MSLILIPTHSEICTAGFIPERAGTHLVLSTIINYGVEIPL